MTAQTLRAAAQVLRERAEKATPGDRWVRNHFIPNSGSLHIERSRYVFSVIGGSDADRDYIATMHPGVGLALADLLDFTANEHEGDGPEGCWECVRWLTVARAILGGDA